MELFAYIVDGFENFIFDVYLGSEYTSEYIITICFILALIKYGTNKWIPYFL